jgi:hypothetical protein
MTADTLFGGVHMNYYNQNQQNEQFHQQQFGPQAIFQHGFAGTDAQQVRQQNQASQGQYGGMGYQQAGGTYGAQPMSMGMGQFTGTHAAFQPGFAGTDPQQVRQQNQASQGQYGGMGYQQAGGTYGAQPMSMGMGQFTGTHAAFQPGFAGTDAQQVRQQNAQVSQGYGYGQGTQSMNMGMTNMGMGQFMGTHAAFQPGFAGTDAQQVRQQNAQVPQGQYSMGYQQSYPTMNMGQFSGPQAIFQHGFAGTDAEQVRQQNAQISQGHMGGMNFPQGGQH